jgi:hypothetical protein
MISFGALLISKERGGRKEEWEGRRKGRCLNKAAGTVTNRALREPYPKLRASQNWQGLTIIITLITNNQ